ncbi:MAG: ComF family protein [Desulfobacter sp.]|nr:MAG: ComF family protein [Desulfobacter sp.]
MITRFRHLSLVRGISSLVFPDKCLKCGIYIRRSPEVPLSACFCTACMGRLPGFGSPFCTCCGRRFSAGDDHLCESCLEKAPVVERVRAAFEYEGIVREAVALFKYQGRLSLARPFERHLFEAYCTWFSKEDIHLILPIPLHRKKSAKRGFNQSFLLIRNLMALHRERYGTPPPWTIDIRSLARVRHTPSQTGLDEKERETNLARAFEWQARQRPEGKNILLVDDVFTTGSTCRSAASALKSAGAGAVFALVLARA